MEQNYECNRDYAENSDIDELYEHFKSLYSVEYDPRNLAIDPNITNRNILENEKNTDDDLDREISMVDLEKAVFLQNNGKSSGLDNLIAKIYKHAFPEISPVLLKLFNHIYQTRSYPTEWGGGGHNCPNT